MKLSDTQSMILLAAAQHEMGLAHAPKTLPAEHHQHSGRYRQNVGNLLA